MLPGSDNDWLWLTGGALVVFVAFLVARFNRHALGSLWEKMPRYASATALGVSYGLMALVWRSMGRDLEFWAWGFMGTVSLVQGAYFFLNRNKPADVSPAAERRRAVFDVLWACLLLLPLAWVITLMASGAEIDRMAWALSAGFAVAAVLGLAHSFQQWRAARVSRDTAAD